MKEYKIRQVTRNEVAELQLIGRQTFSETFSSENTEENMKAYLNEKFSTTKLTTELADPNTELYFVLLDNNVIGYLKVNWGTSQTEIKNENSLEIERIYILKEYHGKQVGQKLYDKAIAVARQKKVDFIWLGVWEKNSRAIGFYRKNGFVEFDKHIFRLGNDEQVDIMMKLELKRAWLVNP